MWNSIHPSKYRQTTSSHPVNQRLTCPPPNWQIPFGHPLATDVMSPAPHSAPITPPPTMWNSIHPSNYRQTTSSRPVNQRLTCPPNWQIPFGHPLATGVVAPLYSALHSAPTACPSTTWNSVHPASWGISSSDPFGVSADLTFDWASAFAAAVHSTLPTTPTFATETGHTMAFRQSETYGTPNHNKENRPLTKVSIQRRQLLDFF